MAFSLFPKNIKQWKVVLIAFLAATTFWFFNSLNKEYTTSFNYPVSFDYNADSLISVKPLPKYVSLDVTGGGWILLRKTAIFSPKPLEIDLSKSLGSSMLQWRDLLSSFREQIGDLNINQILQDTLSVQIEPIRQKKVAIKIDSLSIQLDEEYRVTSPIITSIDSITLTGPKSFIDTLSGSYRLQMPQVGIDDDFNREIPIRVPRADLIISNPSTLDVSFEVSKFEEVELTVGVEWMNTPSNSRLLLDSQFVTVSFLARESEANEFTASDFIVIADYSMLNKSDTTVLAMLTAFPTQVEEVKISPEIIKLAPHE